MDKGVLLVLLCLQVFLLISAFSSADAAVLRRDDQEQLLADQELLAKRSGCWRRPGGCSIFGKVHPPTSPPMIKEDIIKKIKNDPSSLISEQK
ncbi:uncharacterized protein LOC144405523 isoform X2 [Gasterosteus aculeatus]